MRYCLNKWHQLNNFLLDGRTEIRNNRAERTIKSFVIGRKNWLFSKTPDGADASATIYIVIETAKDNGLNPFKYLVFLFEQLPDIDRSNTKQLDSLLPWSKLAQASCKAPN